MSIKKEIEQAINDQINAELESAYLYLSMGAFFEDQELPGFANWMRCQYLEETMHAMKFYNYLIERGGKVELKAIKAPETNWKNYTAVFEATLAHEEYITGRLNKMVSLAKSEEDYAAENFLMWYINEQVEEEDSAKKILTKLKRINESTNGLYMLDSELAGRALSSQAVPIIMNQATA